MDLDLLPQPKRPNRVAFTPQSTAQVNRFHGIQIVPHLANFFDRFHAFVDDSIVVGLVPFYFHVEIHLWIWHLY